MQVKIEGDNIIITIPKNQLHYQGEVNSNSDLTGLHKKTIDFCRELQDHYGSKSIHINDRKFTECKVKYYMTDQAGTLRNLEKRNVIKVLHEHEGAFGRKFIKAFQFV